MAEPNISLLGATYSGVTGVTLPKQGGGTATFPWVEGSETKTSNGTYDVTNLAQLIVNVSGGGGGSYPWFGPNTVKDYTKTITINLKDDTSWDSWTASTTIGNILAASSTNDFSYSFDSSNYAICIVQTAVTSYIYNAGATKNAIPISNGRVDWLIYYGAPFAYTDYQSIAVGVVQQKTITDYRMCYYNSSGNKAAITTTAYGAYLYGAPSGSASMSGTTCTVGIKRNYIAARCNSSYFETARKSDIDSANTNIVITFDVYKIPRTSAFEVRGVNDMITLMNASPANQ